MIESPNFTNELSKLAEKRIGDFIKLAKELGLGVEIYTLKESREEIINEIKNKLPQRFDVVVQKLRENDGVDLKDLSDQILVDRLLGIDVLFKYKGKIYAVDATIAKSSGIINKQRKIAQMEDVYKKLGIDYALIFKITEDITEDILLDVIYKIEEFDNKNNAFTLVIKYPKIKNNF